MLLSEMADAFFFLTGGAEIVNSKKVTHSEGMLTEKHVWYFRTGKKH